VYPRPAGIVTLSTDFGVEDPYVGIMKGAVLRASPKPRVVALAHAVPPQDVDAGAFVLWSAIGRFPDGTVHCGVVDADAGAAQRVLAACAHGAYWLAPDNGLLSAVLTQDASSEVRSVDLQHLGIRRGSATFDGRDVFAPVAALLSAGRYGFSTVGPRVEDAASTDRVFGGADRVVHVDRCGNLVTNIRADRAVGAALELGGVRVPVRRACADDEPGGLSAYVGSFGLFEVAARGGSAADQLDLARGAPVSAAIA